MGASMALTGWAGALALVAGLWSGAAAALPEPALPVREQVRGLRPLPLRSSGLAGARRPAPAGRAADARAALAARSPRLLRAERAADRDRRGAPRGGLAGRGARRRGAGDGDPGLGDSVAHA